MSVEQRGQPRNCNGSARGKPFHLTPPYIAIWLDHCLKVITHNEFRNGTTDHSVSWQLVAWCHLANWRTRQQRATRCIAYATHNDMQCQSIRKQTDLWNRIAACCFILGDMSPYLHGQLFANPRTTTNADSNARRWDASSLCHCCNGRTKARPAKLGHYLCGPDPRCRLEGSMRKTVESRSNRETLSPTSGACFGRAGHVPSWKGLVRLRVTMLPDRNIVLLRVPKHCGAHDNQNNAADTKGSTYALEHKTQERSRRNS